MVKSNRLFLAAALGSLFSLIGLIWDAQIHILEHGSLAVEPLLNLSEPLATNPGHLVFGLGFLLIVGACLAGFTSTWLQLHPGSANHLAMKSLAFPLALTLLIGAAGLATIFYLGSRIVAMSFCEPRSCRLQLSS